MTRTKINLRIDTDLLAAVDAMAAAAAATRTAVIERGLRLALDAGTQAATVATPSVRPAPMDIPVVVRPVLHPADDTGACVHPRSAENRLTYGVFCRDCGHLVR